MERNNVPAAFSHPSFVSFAAGANYGFTSVLVGQPFDTVKTRMQARPELSRAGPMRVFADLARLEGVPGLYRGGLPIFVGGALFRSAQFGFYENTLHALKGSGAPEHNIGGILDWRVVAAGFSGGIGRGLVEGPFEYIKVRRQVNQPVELTRMYEGGGITMLRNSFLFCSFSIYRALVPLLFPDGEIPGGAFWEGAICANLAWLSVWPLDVVKSRVQSGNYKGKGFCAVCRDVVSSGSMFRGLLPGLVRSSLANGCAMVMYKETEKFLSEGAGENQ